MNLFPMSVSPIAALALLTVASCAPADDGSEGSSDAQASEVEDGASASANEAVLVANTAWLSVGEDGSVLTTFLDPDGGYRDGRNGTMADSGRWEQRPDGAICFVPVTGTGDCWTAEALDEDGATIVTNGDGKRVEIKRITYTAPVVVAEDALQSS